MPFTYIFYPFMDCHDNKIYISSTDKIQIFSDSFELLTTIETCPRFIFRNFYTDIDKNLYTIKDLKSEFICKVRKHISKMVEYNEKFFIIDKFGDIYKLEDDKTLKFICGALCPLLDVIIEDDRIYMLDTYLRVRICDMNGKIDSFKFNYDKSGLITYKKELRNIKDVISCTGEIIKILRMKGETVVLTSENIIVVKDDIISKLNYLENIVDICINEKKEIFCKTSDCGIIKL